MGKSAFERIGENTPKEIDSQISRSLDIAVGIIDALKSQSKKPVDLSKSMEKRESEISKWTSGHHNFTLKTIGLIESHLDAKLIYTKREMDEVLVKLSKLEDHNTQLKSRLENYKTELNLFTKEEVESEKEKALHQYHRIWNNSKVYGGRFSTNKASKGFMYVDDEEDYARAI